MTFAKASTRPPVRIALIGCGAISENYYAPALHALRAARPLDVAVLVDPNEGRRTVLKRFFPGAGEQSDIDALAGKVDLAIVASPARRHAGQAIALLNAGIPLLCEKPLAVNSDEALKMIDASEKSGRALAVGLFRRFFPALETIAGFQREKTFGSLLSFEIQEGGPFSWPAATPSFFDPAAAGGGVLLDGGVHVLDVLDWWLGEPAGLVYEDDAQGGLEANCRLRLRYDAGAPVNGSVLLSRDWRTTNAWTLEFERATVRWRVGEADRLEIRPAGSPHWLRSQLVTEEAGGTRPADTYTQAFTRQIADVIDAVNEGRPPRVTARSALASLRLIERCYRDRPPLPAA